MRVFIYWTWKARVSFPLNCACEDCSGTNIGGRWQLVHVSSDISTFSRALIFWTSMIQHLGLMLNLPLIYFVLSFVPAILPIQYEHVIFQCLYYTSEMLSILLYVCFGLCHTHSWCWFKFVNFVLCIHWWIYSDAAFQNL